MIVPIAILLKDGLFLNQQLLSATIPQISALMVSTGILVAETAMLPLNFRKHQPIVWIAIPIFIAIP